MGRKSMFAFRAIRASCGDRTNQQGSKRARNASGVRFLSALSFAILLSLQSLAAEPLHAGFAEVDVTPKLGDKPVFMAGFGHNRKATEVADPIVARAVVLKHDKQKIAIVSIDVVGFFYANVETVRKQLGGFDYVLISSTHNHEGPDTLGLWGTSPFKSGVDPEYMKKLEELIV